MARSRDNTICVRSREKRALWRRAVTVRGEGCELMVFLCSPIHVDGVVDIYRLCSWLWATTRLTNSRDRRTKAARVTETTFYANIPPHSTCMRCPKQQDIFAVYLFPSHSPSPSLFCYPVWKLTGDGVGFNPSSHLYRLSFLNENLF